MLERQESDKEGSMEDEPTTAISISYPCLVIDIGTSRIPKSFDSGEVAETIAEIDIFEAAFGVLESRDTRLSEEDIVHFDIHNDPFKMTLFLEQLEPLVKQSTVIAHNVETDIKLLKGICHLAGHTDVTDNIKSFCTMKHGRQFSRTHVYRGGRKVKKWPHLQELLRNLTGEYFRKGDIFEDVMQCFVCFKLMENMTMI